ncbi:MAG: hypothetical protein HYZ31_05310, partial [Gammaproteobacteria bacterium]|nr:hypothetical protein [Gammaproteobacteria bacterium]
MNTRLQFYILAALSLTSQSIMAAWSLEPSYFLRYERNDNIYLAAPGNELAVTGGSFSPRLAVNMEEETQTLSAIANVNFTRYRDHDELKRDEGRLG